MISIDNISVSYGTHTVIKNLNLELEEGLIHGVLGLNGAGKSTLLNTLFGLKEPKQGSFTVDNTLVSKKNTPCLPTEVFYYSLISDREYLALFKNDNFDVEEWYRLFLLPLDEYVDGYSTGMKKKLSILAMLKECKPLIILDESFNGLDLEACHVLQSKRKNYNCYLSCAANANKYM